MGEEARSEPTSSKCKIKGGVTEVPGRPNLDIQGTRMSPSSDLPVPTSHLGNGLP